MLARSRSFVDFDRIIEHLSSFDQSNDNPIAQFQDAFSRYIDASYCFATNQARAALLIALKALNLENDDEIIVQSFTYHGVVDAILEAGVKPVFADNSIRNLNANSADIEKLITEKTRVIIATHLFGIPCDIPNISEISREKNIYLFEDCAQCLGATYQGKKIGTFGDLAFVSFNYEKNMCTGEGGMLILNNTDLLDQVNNQLNMYNTVPIPTEKHYVYGILIDDILFHPDIYRDKLLVTIGQEVCKRNPEILKLIDELIRKNVTREEFTSILYPHLEKEIKKYSQKITFTKKSLQLIHMVKNKIKKPEYPKIESENLLMNSMRALVGITALESLDATNTIRRKNADLFVTNFNNSGLFILPEVPDYINPVYLKYNVLNNSEVPLSQITEDAKMRGWELGNFQWPEPVHLMPRYSQNQTNSREKLQNSEYIARNIINIPVHCDVMEEDLIGIAEFLNQISDG